MHTDSQRSIQIKQETDGSSNDFVLLPVILLFWCALVAMLVYWLWKILIGGSRR